MIPTSPMIPTHLVCASRSPFPTVVDPDLIAHPTHPTAGAVAPTTVPVDPTTVVADEGGPR